MTTHEIIAFLLGMVAATTLRALFWRLMDGATLARMEQKLDRLLGQPGVISPVSAPPSAVTQATVSSLVLDLLRQGKKIEAINIYR